MKISLNKTFSIEYFNINTLSVVRIIVGILFIYHGHVLWNSQGMKDSSIRWGANYQIPYPFINIYIAKIIQFFGGICLVLGLFTRFAAFGMGITMVVATFIAHKGIILNIPPINGKTAGEGEITFAYLLLYFVIFIIGSGKWSLDYLLTQRKKS